MPLVLAIEPDLRQAAVLKRVVRETTGADVAVVDSRDAAVDAIARAMPDVLLLSALLSPRDEDDLVQHLRTLSGAEHLQTHTIPQLASSLEGPDARGGAVRGLFKAFRRKKTTPAVSAGCDPAAFAEQVRTFIEQAAQRREERAQRDAYLEPTRADHLSSQFAETVAAADHLSSPVTETATAADTPTAYEYETAAPIEGSHWPEDAALAAEAPIAGQHALTADDVPDVAMQDAILDAGAELVIAPPAEAMAEEAEILAAAEPLVSDTAAPEPQVAEPVASTAEAAEQQSVAAAPEYARTILSYAGDAAADPGFAEPDREYARPVAAADTPPPLVAHEEPAAFAHVEEPAPALAVAEPVVAHGEPMSTTMEPIAADVEPAPPVAEPVLADAEPALAVDEAPVALAASPDEPQRTPTAAVRDSLGPLAAWVRFDRVAAAPAVRTTSDELRALMERLSLPLPVASVTYARGCRIRRVRVQGGKSRKTSERTGPVILSKKLLDDQRAPALRAQG